MTARNSAAYIEGPSGVQITTCIYLAFILFNACGYSETYIYHHISDFYVGLTTFN